ncbi:hypothetical protein D9758_004938 [Tetrapyrgos nigripes]|uniref:C2H2-type domain-containing protein n=1 Tax=Tetrapyrgos nigripes TaxID=182062 RepID=A0A8H5LWS6_9AGAR|nr:hypothetical protein D9758_004938 [Tetrapyrgos nigripes]
MDEDGLFPCGQCPKRFTTQRGWKQHQNYKHRPAADTPRFPTPNFRTPSPAPLSGPSSPIFSSRRSPRRRQNGSPVRLTWAAAPLELQRYGTQVTEHPILDGTPCDIYGDDLPEDTPPPALEPRDPEDYTPFGSADEFELAELLYERVQMSASNIDRLSQLIANLLGPDKDAPFLNHEELYKTIDRIKQGDIQWDSFTVKYNGELPDDLSTAPAWKLQEYEVWFRDPLSILEGMLANPSFKNELDVAPKRLVKNGKRLYRDLMTGNWAWFECDKISEDENTHGAMFAPVILGSDKTTVSVATGQNDYYPLYISLGNVHSSVRRAHRNAVALLGFLAIPKTSKDYAGSAEFRKFRRQLFHTSLEHVLSSLKPFMEKPRVTRCPDGHYRRVIYGLGPYIADYPEQALLACIVQNWCPRCTARPENLDRPAGRRSHEHTDTVSEGCSLKEVWDNYGIVADLKPFTAGFPRADIHELLAPDLLHQLVKGTFKDHLVDWVVEYINLTYDKSEAERRLADIDRRIMVTTPFPGLRHFHEGRGFKQWTGADSKGLMKASSFVFLPAIAGHVPVQMVQAVSDFLEFCYLVRRNVIDEDNLDAIDAAIARFHQNREIFRETGVRPDGFSPLPRQHSMVHYRHLIQQFGAPNGLCSSITESKHIKAVKRPWRRSSRNQPLGQMLVTNQRLDKLAAYRVDLECQCMLDPVKDRSNLPPPPPPPPPQEEDDEDTEESGDSDEPYSQGDVKLSTKAARGVPRDINTLAAYINQPTLPILLRQFLYTQQHLANGPQGCNVPLASCPELERNQKVFLHNSAKATFFAPSDMSGLGGMRHERIRSTTSWRRGPSRYDCVFMEGDQQEDGFGGLLVGRVFAFLRFTHEGRRYPCALIHWFSTVGNTPCEQTGLWRVVPDFDRNGDPVLEVVHLDCLYRGAHLIGVTGSRFIPDKDFTSANSLDMYQGFYVNKYVDYHAHEIAF